MVTVSPCKMCLAPGDPDLFEAASQVGELPNVRTPGFADVLGNFFGIYPLVI